MRSTSVTKKARKCMNKVYFTSHCTVCVQIFAGRIFRKCPSSGGFSDFFRESPSVPED